MNKERVYESRSLIKLNKRGVGGAIALLLLLPSAAWSGGVVTNCTEAALRAAMAGGGLVTFACDGTIHLTNTITITKGSDTTLDGSGRQVIVSGYGAPVFAVKTNVSFTVVNLTVADSTSLGGSGINNLGGTVNLNRVTFRSNTATLLLELPVEPPQYIWNLRPSGGAIYNSGGTVNATNCSFLGNTAQTKALNDFLPGQAWGGAIGNDAGQVHLRSCTFEGNRAFGGAGFAGPTTPGTGDPGFGGAVYNTGTLTVDLCTFANNSVSGGAGADGTLNYAGFPGGEGSGGAVFNQGTLVADRTAFCVNTATGGTGGRSMGGNSSTWDGFAGAAGAGAKGGAICNLGSCWVTRSMLASNVVTGAAGGGGGGGLPWNDIGGNGGRGGEGGSSLGAGLFNSGAASLVNCTIALNTGRGGAGGGGGPGADNRYGGRGGDGGSGGSGMGGVHGTCSLTNCTIALNLGSGGSGGPGGPGGSGLYPGAPGANGSDGVGWNVPVCGTLPNTLIASNTPAWSGEDSFLDPKLGPLADNGGPTLTMALLPGSPAIDAANTALAPETDQRGFPRPAGLAADIGAFEYGSVMPTLAVSLSCTNGLNLVGSGNAGQPCRLLSSPDLTNWLPLATNQIGSEGTVLFYDTCATGGASRFYRLAMP